ncbi:MAG: ATP-binding protein [Steroidobacteraceae bacterium]
MRAPASVSRRLLISVAVPLALFFALTVLLLDIIYRNLADQSLGELLDEQMIALLAATDVDDQGNIDVRLQDPESRLVTPGSGHYALVRDKSGAVLWSSLSLVGVRLNWGPPVAVGSTQTDKRELTDGGHVAVSSRGLQWEIAPGVNRDLVFSVAEITAPYERRLQRFRTQLVGWFLLLALALLGTLAWRMRRALEPVRRLEREIGAVERGELQHLGADYPRELAGVTGNLNAMIDIERQRIARYRDTLGNLAHSLKTPLAVMRALMQKEGGVAREALEPEVARIAQIVEHQLRRAVSGGGGPMLGQAAVPVAPLAAELRVALLKVYASRDLSIEIDVPAPIGFLGDRGDLLELLGNLLDNACKWCRQRVRLSVQLTPQAAAGQRLRLVVEDDGPGIAPDDRERVTQRGVRADERQPGHGLGLAMVRETVQMYGGSLQIETSAALGGAALIVTLPGR